MADHWAEGGKGAADLARAVVKVIDERQEQPQAALSRRHAAVRQDPHHRQGDLPRRRHLRAQAGARQLASFEAMGFGHLPVCIAKTQYSFSTDPDAQGRARGPHPRGARGAASAGAEFVVAICGDIMTMPGLPRVPSADSIDIDAEGKIVGLF